MSGVQALKKGTVTQSEIKCLRKTSTNTHKASNTTHSLVLHVSMPRPCFMSQLHSSKSGHKSDVIFSQ
jgi:hypothetical protein